MAKSEKKFILIFLVILNVILNTVICGTTEDENYVGIKGITKQRIDEFEKLIKENKEPKTPELKVVKRTKPYIKEFPLSDGEDSDLVSGVSEYTRRREPVKSSDDTISHEGEDKVLSSDDMEDDVVGVSEAEESVSDDIASQAELGSYNIEISDQGDAGIAENLDENETATIDDSEEPKLTKRELKMKEKENKKLQKERERERKRLEKEKKEEEKRLKKQKKEEEKKLLKEKNLEEKRKRLEEKNKERERKREERKNKISERNSGDICVRGGSGGIISKLCTRKNKGTQTSTESQASTVDTSDDDKTSSSESNNGLLSETEDNDVIIEKRSHYGVEELTSGEESSDDEELKEEVSEDNEASRLFSSFNESDFKTERISSEAVIDNDSDYVETSREEGDSRPRSKYDKFRFSGESEDLISKERAVEPLEDIEIESLTEGDETEGSNLDSGVESHASITNSDLISNEVSEVSNIDVGDDSSLDTRDVILDKGGYDGDETDVEDSVDVDLSDKENELVESSSKISRFFGKIKNAFKKKPNLTPSKSCSRPGSDKSTRGKPKYTKDFVPAIYLLSRDVPRDELYNIPEIASSLRSESSRMVFAYQLMDGNLMPSSSLALNSKSFITRRWGKKIQAKLVKLRSEFDKLKNRLSEMYHNGVIRGEFELFIEEIDDLTIMLYFAAKEFPSRTKYSMVARDILRFPEVVASPGERLLSIFRKARKPRTKCVKGKCTVSEESQEQQQLRKLKKRLKLIKKRYRDL